jgi:hypothetical protein
MPAGHFQPVEMVEQGDLARVVSAVDVVDGQLFAFRGAFQRRVEGGIDIGEAAGQQQVRAARTGFSPQAERRVAGRAGQPASQGGDGFRVAAGDEVVQQSVSGL